MQVALMDADVVLSLCCGMFQPLVSMVASGLLLDVDLAKLSLLNGMQFDRLVSYLAGLRLC
eukprot:4604627-Karenia_brevis.AAC.1